MRAFSALFILLVTSLGAFAQQKGGVDPKELDYDTNLSVPAVPAKQVGDIRHHMNSIQDALHRMSFKTSRKRDKEVVTVIIPCSELFAPNDTVLKEQAKNRLQLFAKFLKYPTMYKIVVAVYTDNTGEPSYCDHLSEVRANAIDDYLIDVGRQGGLKDINVIPYGMGMSGEVVPNTSVENRAANRRVEINIIPEWQMIETARSGKLK